jgi:hypothetical protein
MPPSGVAVDSTGNLYVTDRGNNRVLKLPANSSAQEVVPFAGLNSAWVWRWIRRQPLRPGQQQQTRAEAIGVVTTPAEPRDRQARNAIARSALSAS